jgi:hypothetical protein
MSAHDDYLDPDRAGLNDEVEDNEHIKEAFGDYDGPGQLYRTAYKYTGCGPSIGLQIMEWVTDVSEEPTYEMCGDDDGDDATVFFFCHQRVVVVTHQF